ncbi:protein NOI4-like isoform X2 [Hevea brasiliensis]|uniref:protein NOI4-like isoform X2 n=1 Tax=Hevea brasiliensis TaxID=3981 RepID=UPI000B79007B|nr:protein NOI4-like isoform X2 [Hevea brasiliensis]
MASDKGLPLPKFGEWDVSNPASAEGFTVIFNKARDKKKTKNAPAKVMSPRRNDAVHKNNDSYQNSPKWKWLCCG